MENQNEMNVMSMELDNNMKTYHQDKEDVSEYMKKQLAKLEKQEKQKEENKDENEEKNEDENI